MDRQRRTQCVCQDPITVGGRVFAGLGGQTHRWSPTGGDTGIGTSKDRKTNLKKKLIISKYFPSLKNLIASYNFNLKDAF